MIIQLAMRRYQFAGLWILEQISRDLLSMERVGCEIIMSLFSNVRLRGWHLQIDYASRSVSKICIGMGRKLA
jgi:hypothetical protein